MINFLKAAPVVFLIGTIVTGILYQKTLLGIWLTIAITFGTTNNYYILSYMHDGIVDKCNHPSHDKMISRGSKGNGNRQPDS